MKSLARYTLMVLITLTSLVVLWQIRQAVVIFLFSLVTAAVFRPLVVYLVSKKLSRSIALLISYGLVIVVGVGLLIVITGPLVLEIEQATNQLVSGYEQIMTFWPTSNLLFLRSLAMLLPPPEKLYAGLTGQGNPEMIQAMLGVTTNAVAFITNLGIILVLSLYWSADSLHFERLLLSMIPVEWRSQARLIWQGIEKGLGAYIRSELTQSILAGVLLWLGYRLMGLDYPLLLAFLGALLWLIPWFGAILALILPFFVGLSGGVPLAILATLYTLAVLLVQELVIEPRIFRRHTYSSIVLILVALALGDVFGLVGLILAPLVSATLQIVFKYLLPTTTAVVTARQCNETAEGIEALQLRLAKARNEMDSWENPAPPEIANLTGRLDKLIADIQQYLN